MKLASENHIEISPKKTQKRSEDTWLWPNIFFPSFLLLAASTLISFYPQLDFIIILLGLIPAIAWLITLGIWIINSIRFKQPKKLFSIYLSIVFSLILLKPSFVNVTIGDYIHLTLLYPAYLVQISKTPQKLHSFDWGGFGFVGTVSGDIKLVYDPKDNLALNEKIENMGLSYKNEDGKRLCEHLQETNHLIEHFYKVEDLFGEYYCPE